VSDDHDSNLLAPPLPVRASIYIAPDGGVHFGALFAELVPVAAALGHGMTPAGSNDRAPTASSASSPSTTVSSSIAPG
jgi:hypothetical protein